jgi:hypothetical protein
MLLAFMYICIVIILVEAFHWIVSLKYTTNYFSYVCLCQNIYCPKWETISHTGDQTISRLWTFYKFEPRYIFSHSKHSFRLRQQDPRLIKNLICNTKYCSFVERINFISWARHSVQLTPKPKKYQWHLLTAQYSTTQTYL